MKPLNDDKTMKALPNTISVVRICLVPAFVIAYSLEPSQIKYITIAIFVAASISDILDGYLARKLSAQTRLGKILDPMGDKLFIFSALVCMATTRHALIWVAFVYFIKEILMSIGGIVIEKKGLEDFPSSNWLGKTSTVVFFVACLAELVFFSMPDLFSVTFFSVAMCFALSAFINYLHLFAKLLKGSKTSENDDYYFDTKQ